MKLFTLFAILHGSDWFVIDENLTRYECLIAAQELAYVMAPGVELQCYGE